ncbi:DNA-deoxyinosine glycosylase [Chryseobacterium gossypii]|uniref:DNA-deoxyinosine glycosylase n=1 Tax=Chryseobacterium gossypii TaxID=3231602 RepID=UPI00352680C3
MQNRISSFPPLIDAESEILILGSIPGVRSLEKQQYYAHPQNKFWKIIFTLLDEEFTEDYPERIRILKKHHIALWDVIDSCERKGSLDSEIRNEEANRIAELLEEHPHIKAIFCNGGKSYKSLQKLLGKNYHLPVFLLPSTSPLHTVSFENKLEEWKKILDFLKFG